ncbi:MAG: TerC family protein [Candidatus Nanopelagicales bacterium]|nr:TerC family protein [Candidatus Nanopelagicales bacterium]
MNVPTWMWLATIGVLIAIIVVDLFIVDSRPHAFSTREAGIWVTVYLSLAAVFAVFMAWYFGLAYGGQFVAGYLTEYSLSVDNLFVFLVLMTSFSVPVVLQHRVLLVGVVIALILRGVLILIGAELIARFAGVFYLFGAFLFFTAWKVWTSHDEAPDPQGNGLVRFVSKRFAISPHYDGNRLSTRVAGRRMLTPMALVMIAIGTTDVLFALDSIPAVFGITHEAYIVFAANAFALMGLRQLYFLLQGLMGRLRYLNYGLAIILAFIGAKLVLEAIHETTSLQVPVIPIWLSLTFIVVVLVVTAVTSLLAGPQAEEPDPARPEPDTSTP